MHPSAQDEKLIPQTPHSGKSHPPIASRRREAPQPPSYPSSLAASPVRPIPSNVPTRQSSQDSTAPQIPPNWPAELNLSTLPPLPPGLSIAHLAQYGTTGLEMAIRLGMGIGMGLTQQQPGGDAHGQQTQQQQQQPDEAASRQQSQQRDLRHESQQPVSAAPSIYGTGTPSSHQSPATEHSKTSKGHNIVNDILNDNFLAERKTKTPAPLNSPLPGQSGSYFTIPLHSTTQSGAASPAALESASPESMAAKDPLAAQVWKAYAKSRDAVPNGQRMENLTWRLMHLTLKKKDDAALPAVKEEAVEAAAEPEAATRTTSEETVAEDTPERQRGRSKGKARVVGFQKAGTPEQPQQAQEYVPCEDEGRVC